MNKRGYVLQNTHPLFCFNYFIVCSLGSYMFSSNSIAFVKQRHCVYISIALLFDRKSNEFFSYHFA